MTAAAVPPPPPPPPTPPGPLSRLAGEGRGRPADGPGSLAGIAERVGARAIDAVVLFVLVVPLVAVEAAIRVATGMEATEEGDGLTSAMGLAMVAVWGFYDPVATKLLGASVGKRLLGLRIERADGEPVEAGRIAGRWLLELLLLGCWLVPGFLSIAAARNHPLRQSWHDRAASTVVVRADASRSRPPEPVSSASPLPEPWASLVADARLALARFEQTSAAAADGPVKERLLRVRSKVEGCVLDCERLARRGAEVATLAAGVDLAGVEGRAQAAEADAAARGGDRDAAALAVAVRNEATSARHLTELVGTTERRLRRSVAQLNDAVNRSAQVVFDAGDPSRSDHLVDELAALQAALAETAADLGSGAPLGPAGRGDGAGSA